MLEIINGFISCAIFLITVYVYGILLFKNNLKKANLKNYVISFVICIIHTFIFLSFDGVIKTILTCIICSSLLKNLFYINTPKAIFSSILYIILLIVPDLLALTIVTNVLNISKEYCYTTIAGSIFSNILVSIIMIIMMY